MLTTLTLSMSSIAFAGQWNQDSAGWWYDNGNGTWPANSWQWIDGNNDGNAECYYFDQYGYCLMNTTTPDGYQVDSNGAWIINGVIQTRNVQPLEVASQSPSEQYLLDVVQPYKKEAIFKTEPFKMGGKEYDNGFVTWGDTSENYFNLEGKYSELSCIMGVVSPTWDHATVKFSVYADDELVDTVEMGMDDLPVEKTFDINGCHKLLIKVYDGYNATGTGRYGIAEITVK